MKDRYIPIYKEDILNEREEEDRDKLFTHNTVGILIPAVFKKV